MRKYVLGIDQGGTKTDVLIADDTGNILGLDSDRGYDPGEGERREKRMRRIGYAVKKLLAQLGMSIGDVDVVYANCNGADWPFEYAVGEKNLRQTLQLDNIKLYIDCMGALRGGIDPAGINTAVVCLGTGGNAAVRNAAGRELIYGYYYRDQDQGGSAMGRAVFEAVFAADIGLGESTLLTALLLKEFPQFGSVTELFTAITTGRTEDEKPLAIQYKQYAWIMLAAMRQGDRVATRFIADFCHRICKYILHGATKLQATHRLTLVLSGGILKIGPEIGLLVANELGEKLQDFRAVNARYEPVAGVTLYCFDSWYPNGIPPQVLQQFDHHCVEHRLIRMVEEVARERL